MESLRLPTVIVSPGLLEEVQAKTDYCFQTVAILEEALTAMPDWALVGDATIKFLVHRHLLHCTRLSLGEKTVVQQSHESNELFGRLVGELGLTRVVAHIVIDDQEYRGPATFFEALVAAIAEDGGITAADQFLTRTLFRRLALPEDTITSLLDFCTTHQIADRIQLRQLRPFRRGGQRLNQAAVRFDGRVIGHACHRRADEAGRRAARLALRHLPNLVALPG